MRRAYSKLMGLLLILAFSESWATTLGDINVLSAVGEPFSATIEVELGETESADQMIARIASADTHTAFGIAYVDYASTIKIEVVQRKEKLLLILNSQEDLREVYLEFIFQLQFFSGSIFRAYSVLPEFNIPRIGAAEKNVQQANRTRRKIPAGSYTVQSLDSLWLIAAAMDRKLGSVAQRILLLEAANPALEDGEMHPGDKLIIPADRLPIRKPANLQKRENTGDMRGSTGDSVSQPVDASIIENINPVFASEKALTAVARRAAGYRIVRLTALNGPQFSQSQSGVETLSKDASNSLSLEIEEIRMNLEILAQENATLTNDIRRLKAQDQQRQRETESQERSYPLTAPPKVLQPEERSSPQDHKPNTNVAGEIARESGGISSTFIFLLIVILIGVVGIVLWVKRKRESREEIEDSPVTRTTQTSTASISETVQEAPESTPSSMALPPKQVDLATPTQDRNRNSTDNAPPEKIRASHQSDDTDNRERDTDFHSSELQSQKTATDATTGDLPGSPQPTSILPLEGTIDFVSTDRSVIEAEPETETETETEAISDKTATNDPDPPLEFEDLEFVEEFEEDHSDISDLKFELELDAETENVILGDKEFLLQDEIDISSDDIISDESWDDDPEKSMSEVFEDLHLQPEDHEHTISSLSNFADKPDNSSPGLTSNMARWADLQEEWDEAIASGIDEGQSLAVVYIELDDITNIEDQQGPMRTEGLITEAHHLLSASLQTTGRSLHRIKDHTFLFLVNYKTEADLREHGKSLVRTFQDHNFVIRNEHLKLSLSVGIVPFTSLFNSLDDYLRCGKITVSNLRAELVKARIKGGVAIHFEGSNEAEDWENEGAFLAKVNELLQANLFEVEYQTLINLSGNHQQVYMCKTELSAQVDTQVLPANFLKKAFTCSATPEIERQSIMTFMDKIRSLGDDTVQMLFRIDIRSAMDPQFGGWLFKQLEVKGIDPTSITLFVYADDVIAYKPNIMSFAETLRQHGSRLGMLNVDYDSNHLQAALEVGASIVRVKPSLVDEVVESSVRFGSRPVTSGTRESSRFKDFLTSFQKRDIETVLFSTFVEAIPGLVVLNSSNLRASYIQTPIGMIEDDDF